MSTICYSHFVFQLRIFIINKELAYIYGFFYADGCLRDHKYLSKKGLKTYYSIRLEIVSSDAISIQSCLDNTNLIYTKSTRFRKNSKNEQTCFNISIKSKDFDSFKSILSNKTDMSISKSLISDKMYRFFLRGFFDGDGCITYNEKTNRSISYFYGSFDQIWTPIFDVLNNLDIKYTYQKLIRKNGKHKSSHICISNKMDIIKLFDFIYPDRTYDFGLERKFNKFLHTNNTVNLLYRHKSRDTDIIKTYT